MSDPGTWGAPAPGGGVSVAWTAAAPAAMPAAPRSTVDVGAALRLVGAGLLLVAAGLIAAAPFTTLLSLTYGYGSSYSMTGWADDTSASGDAIRFGIPMVVVAALLLGAAGLAVVAHWAPGWRRRSLAAAVVAVSALVPVTWLVTGYARDVVGAVTGYGDDSGIGADTGTGVLLGTLALLVGLAALASLLLGAALDHASATRKVTR